MARHLHVTDGIITNIVEYGSMIPEETYNGSIVVPDPGNLNVGEAFDVGPIVKERFFNKLDTEIILKEFFRLTNEIRVLNSQTPLTPGQYKAFIIARMT